MALEEIKTVKIVDLKCDLYKCGCVLGTFKYDIETDYSYPENEYSFCDIDCLGEFITSTLTPDFVLNDIYKYPSNIEEIGSYIKVILNKIEQNSERESK